MYCTKKQFQATLISPEETVLFFPPFSFFFFFIITLYKIIPHLILQYSPEDE